MAHASAGSLALDSAFGIEAPPNGRIIRNLILGSNYIQSHILHFFHLAALDYVKGPDVPPFVPRYEADFRLPADINEAAVNYYLEALTMRRRAHEMTALWGGKMPHQQAIVAGGVTEVPDTSKIYQFVNRLEELTAWVDSVYVPTVKAVADVYADWFEIGAGCKNMLSYGAFPLEQGMDHIAKAKFFPSGTIIGGVAAPLDINAITEQVGFSWYNDGVDPSPTASVLEPNLDKADAYSFLKAPRYNNNVMEVGPLARMLVMEQADVTALGAKAYSVMGRHFARAVECSLLAHSMAEWALQLEAGQPVSTPYEIPQEAQGIGLTEAPRGALGHWNRLKNHQTAVYNAIVPSTWNMSPRDDSGQLGAMEQALIGTPVADAANPVEVVRVIRSFDPCLACAIHLMTPDQKVLSQFTIG